MSLVILSALAAPLLIIADRLTTNTPKDLDYTSPKAKADQKSFTENHYNLLKSIERSKGKYTHVFECSTRQLHKSYKGRVRRVELLSAIGELRAALNNRRYAA